MSVDCTSSPHGMELGQDNSLVPSVEQNHQQQQHSRNTDLSISSRLSDSLSPPISHHSTNSVSRTETESLRWDCECSDEERERERIEVYKANRRKRYETALDERRAEIAGSSGGRKDRFYSVV